MKWNVILQNFESGRLCPFNVFDHEAFRMAVEEIATKNYPRERFVKELYGEADYFFGAQAEWETIFTTWPPYIDKEELNRLVKEYHIEEKPIPDRIDVNLDHFDKIDVFHQLRANWDRFADYVWRESQK